MEFGRIFHCQTYHKPRWYHVVGRMGTETMERILLMSLLDYQTRPSKLQIDHHCMMVNVSCKSGEVRTLGSYRDSIQGILGIYALRRA